jgi:hypothetical protein
VYADELALDVPQRGDASTPEIHECAVRVCSHQAHRAPDELDKALLASGLSPGEQTEVDLRSASFLPPERDKTEVDLEVCLLSTSGRRENRGRPRFALGTGVQNSGLRTPCTQAQSAGGHPRAINIKKTPAFIQTGYGSP